MKYQHLISYNGANYQGWQCQSNTHNTIQQVIKDAIQSTINSRDFNFYGASRTDAGVHAFEQVAVIETDLDINIKKLTAKLPQDITLLKCAKIDSAFNPQVNIKSKVYEYYFTDRQDVAAQYRHMIYIHPLTLNLASMKAKAKRFIGEHDFSSLAVKRDEGVSGIRTIYKSEVKKINFPGLKFPIYCFEVEASGFMKYMVRFMVASLYSDSKENIVKAPALGLHLKKIKYGDENEYR